MSEVYARDVKVMFQHCDPAGIVFYPRYFEMINAVVEDWFDEEIGISFAAMHGPLQIGVPAARIAVDFTAPSRLGDVLAFTLDVARLGGASLDLRLAARGPDGPRLTCALTLVHIDMASMRARPWSPAIRERIAPLVEGAA